MGRGTANDITQIGVWELPGRRMPVSIYNEGIKKIGKYWVLGVVKQEEMCSSQLDIEY